MTVETEVITMIWLGAKECGQPSKFTMAEEGFSPQPLSVTLLAP